MEKRRARFSDLLDVAVVGAAAPTHHVQAPEPLREASVVHSELRRIANVELGRLVQFRVTLARRVRPKTAQSLDPRATIGHRIIEMRRMGAVDCVIRCEPAVASSASSIAALSV